MTRKAKKREEGKAFKVVQKLGGALDGFQPNMVGSPAFLVDLALKRLERDMERSKEGPRTEDALAMHCLNVAKMVLSKSFGMNEKANGLRDVASLYSGLFADVPACNKNIRLVKFGLEHIVSNMETLIEDGRLVIHGEE